VETFELKGRWVLVIGFTVELDSLLNIMIRYSKW